MKKTLFVVILLAISVMVITASALSNTPAVRPTIIKNGNQTTIIASVNSTNNIPAGDVLAKRVSNEGLSLELYLPPTTVKKGDSVIIYTIVRNENILGASSINGESITITDSNGSIVYQGGSYRLGGGDLAAGKWWDTTVVWNTGTSYKGVTPQIGTVHVQVTVSSLDAEAYLTLTN